MLFISESKISCKRAYNWLNELNFNGVVGCDPNGTKGGLLFFRNKSVDITLRSFSSSHIDLSVVWKSISWRFTGVYAPPVPEDRLAFWDLLHKLFKLRRQHNEPWLIGGDFNDILYDSEKKGEIEEEELILITLIIVAAAWGFTMLKQWVLNGHGTMVEKGKPGFGKNWIIFWLI